MESKAERVEAVRMVARPVTVHLPAGQVPNLDTVNKIVANALGRLGCGNCFSGFDIRFNHIRDLVVDPKTFQINEIAVG